MLLSLIVALQLQAPIRAVRDPGVIATDQRITPAGIQTVFDGRVSGVRFGETARELWVAVPNGAWHLDWPENRVLGRAVYDGRPGVHGLAVDPVTKRVVVSSVGKLPDNRLPGAAPVAREKSVAQLQIFRSDSTTFRVHSSGSIGGFMAGGPSVARSANTSGRRPLVVPLPADDKLQIVDADDGTLLGTVALGVLPIASAISLDGSTAWVSVLGGAKPKSGERATRQCCDPMAEAVRIDAKGIAQRGTVVRVDVVGAQVVASIDVGLHPTGIAWDEARARLFVANGNSDEISIIDTNRNSRIGSIAITPFASRKIGLSPTAVAVSSDGGTLVVALGGVNAVAEYRVQENGGTITATLLGLIPVGWYPNSLDLSPDGKFLAVGTLLGVGSGEGQTDGHPGQRDRFVHANRGSVHVIPMPTDAELAAYTTSVSENNRLPLARDSVQLRFSVAPRADVPARAVPERPGEPSPIEHVVYIIKENRTYDQVFGDIGKGASDPKLVMYGRDVTPNAHALAEQFVLLDHFFASGGNSADGHQWLTQANETEYPRWPLYFGRSYPSEGNDALAYSSGGFLWESAQAKGRRVVSFGEYAPAPSDSIASVRAKLLAKYRDSQPHNSAFFRSVLGKRYNTRSPIPSLDKILVREYPGWTQEVPDVVKADVILEHLREWTAAGAMPNLVFIILPSDHTVGTSAGWCTPSACVADNDLALGKIVEGLTHSEFWKKMAILVVEDDAQNGVDHIDGHRTVALVASPYAKRGAIDSSFYSQPSMVKTIELMLGLPALSIFDLVARDMRSSFIGDGEKPDATPFTALVPKQSIYELNQRVGDIRGPHSADRKRAAVASARMNFLQPDAAPSDRLNRILWSDAVGWGKPFPGVRRALFFPMSIDIADDDREEKKKP
jgi:DNA-binding beta-propeller fold protein YncE